MLNLNMFFSKHAQIMALCNGALCTKQALHCVLVRVVFLLLWRDTMTTVTRIRKTLNWGGLLAVQSQYIDMMRGMRAEVVRELRVLCPGL